MPGIRVISPGFLTTVQDLGRFGMAHLGVSPAGAADPLSMRLGNLLLGNPEGAPALEMTLTGAELEFEVESDISLAGSAMDAFVDEAPVPVFTGITIERGQTLKCGAIRPGLRTYLCVRGGVDVPRLFGSASTHLMTRMGGFQGRALRPGDSIPFAMVRGTEVRRNPRLRPELARLLAPSNSLRVTSGPQERLFSQAAIQKFYSSTYEVTNESDRMGLRLRPLDSVMGESLPDILTEGVTLGAIQITPSGDPIILFVDHQTTGGYPKIANVISADVHRIGQLRPGSRISFNRVSLAEAVTILSEQESLLLNHPFGPA